MNVSVESRCIACKRHEPVGFRRGRVVHSVRDGDGCATAESFGCADFDAECRHAAEPLGFYSFAWRPRRCRNRRLRWLTWVERHADGSFTLGNRAH